MRYGDNTKHGVNGSGLSFTFRQILLRTMPSSQHKNTPKGSMFRGASLNAPFLDFVRAQRPEVQADTYLSVQEVNNLRHAYLEKMLLDERNELNRLEKEVMSAIRDNAILSGEIDLVEADRLTLGQRLADHIAAFGGSWTFILSFFSILLAWIAGNLIMASRAFDPYPFILLNLVLSCVAAIQAPIIMMSQNRQEEKDRRRAENDFKVNLKAELELRLLHEKIDHLLVHQNQRLLEIQEMQVEYLQDIMQRMKK